MVNSSQAPVPELQLCLTEQEYNGGGLDLQESHRTRAASQSKGSRFSHGGDEEFTSVQFNRYAKRTGSAKTKRAGTVPATSTATDGHCRRAYHQDSQQ
jgi:hypothetical protein